MAEITVTLSEAEIKTAIAEYLTLKGYSPTPRFNVSISVTPGDRPFEAEYTTARVSGVELSTNLIREAGDA